MRDFALGAAAVLASASLLGCPGGGGGGGDDCPEIGGDWSVSGTCTSSSCEFVQDGCSITIECADGRTFEGTIDEDSASFKDSDATCTGEFEGLDNVQGDGTVAPGLEGSCRIDGDSCDFFAECFTGDCRVPDDDGSSDEGDSGEGGRSGQGGASGFLGGGQSGGDGDGDGDGDAGEGGIGGAGEGGVSGVAGGPAGSGGVGGVVSNDCGGCLQSACSSEINACDAAVECGTLFECLIESGCALDDQTCVEDACADVIASLPPPDPADEAAVEALDTCIFEQCQAECVSGGPVAGTGGAGGEGGVGGVPPSGGSGGSVGGCTDTCVDAADGACDDGGPGYDFMICDLGTDCTDCGPR